MPASAAVEEFRSKGSSTCDSPFSSIHRALDRLAPSTGPPPTEPRMEPSGKTSIRAPDVRGADPELATMPQNTASCPRSKTSSNVFKISFTACSRVNRQWFV